MNQNLLDHISTEPTGGSLPLTQKKSKADIIMFKLFSRQPKPIVERIPTANEESTWKGLKDMNEFNQAHEDTIKDLGEKHV